MRFVEGGRTRAEARQIPLAPDEYIGRGWWVSQANLGCHGAFTAGICVVLSGEVFFYDFGDVVGRILCAEHAPRTRSVLRECPCGIHRQDCTYHRD
jgi:hypothetical protein